MKTYGLIGSREKAYVVINDDGSETLYSYNTKIMTIKTDRITRHYNGWTMTTGKHIKLFSGLNKKEFMELDYD